MWFFQEITLHPTEEISDFFLMSKVYARLHLALVKSKDAAGKIRCGLSFPEYTAEPRSLGRKIRVLTQDEETLKQMDIPSVLSQFVNGEYVHIAPVRIVPIRRVKQYAIYSRYQPESSVERKARRYAKRHAISVEEARGIFPVPTSTESFPYVRIKSRTTGKNFSLFIQKKLVEIPKNEETDSTFSAYGISPQQAVPEF